MKQTNTSAALLEEEKNSFLELHLYLQIKINEK